jgi:hypothetical protein
VKILRIGKNKHTSILKIWIGFNNLIFYSHNHCNRLLHSSFTLFSLNSLSTRYSCDSSRHHRWPIPTSSIPTTATISTPDTSSPTRSPIASPDPPPNSHFSHRMLVVASPRNSVISQCLILHYEIIITTL